MSVLSNIIENVRLATNESSDDAKYTDSVLIRYLQAAWPQVVDEINRMSENPIVVRHNISVTANTQDYILPPHVGEVLKLAKLNTETGVIEWEVRPRSFWNRYGDRASFEGNTVRFTPIPEFTDTLTLWYIPNGEISPVVGTVTSYDSTAVTLTLNVTATAGSFDKRTNAYAGYVVEVTDGNDGGHIEERTVSASSVNSSGVTILTLNKVFSDFTPASGDVIELVPIGMTGRIELAVSLYVATIILAQESDTEALQLVERKYVQAMRNLRLSAAGYERRVGKYFDRQTPENRRYAPVSLPFSW